MNTYNGWPTKETWQCWLWISNTYDLYCHARQLATLQLETPWTADDLADDLADYITDLVQEQHPGPDLASDLLSAALQRIHWHSIALAIMDHL